MPSPLAHSLMGAALYRDGSSSVRDRQWPALALFVFLANAPDLDFLPGLVHGNPFAFHRLVTHSLAFAAGGALLVYLVMALLRRPYPRRIGMAVLFGLLSHIALDYFCGGEGDGVAILWPLSDVRVLSPIRFFPGLSTHHVFGMRNVSVALIELSIMMILMQITSLHRLWTVASHRRRGERRAARPAESMSPAAD